MRSTGGESRDELLDEQVAYYRAVAAEYEDHALPLPGGPELAEALDAFRPTGSVLELACGPGTWTTHLLRHAADVTAVDASAEMLAIASARVGKQRVRFVSADLFHWRPDRRYDVVFFGFWLSHVPPERFASFWSLVAECLKPDGRVFFVDDGYRPADELVEASGPRPSGAGKDVLLGLDQSPSDQEAARAQLNSAMDGLNAAAMAKDAKVRDAMSALADDYRQILDAVAAGPPAPTGLDDKLGKDANRIDQRCTIGGAAD